MKRNIVIAMTGASGAPYAVRLVEVLLAAGYDIQLTISSAAQSVLKQELGLAVDLDHFEPAMLLMDSRPGLRDDRRGQCCDEQDRQNPKILAHNQPFRSGTMQVHL